MMKLLSVYYVLMLSTLEVSIQGSYNSEDSIKIALRDYQDATIECSIGNFMRWTLNGKNLEEFQRQNILVHGKQLMFRPAYLSNKGLYLCEGYDNNNMLLKRTYEIYVGVDVEHVVWPHVSYKTIGQQLRMHCPSLKDTVWFFNYSKRLPSGLKFFHQDTVMIINSVQYYHEGDYVCYGFDNLAPVPFISYGRLIVYDKSSQNDKGMMFDMHLNESFKGGYGKIDPSQVAYVGDNIVIRCKSKTYPVWTKSHVKLEGSGILYETSYNNKTDANTYELYLYNLSSAYGGKYNCMGKWRYYDPFVAKSSLYVGERDDSRIDPSLQKVNMWSAVNFTCKSDLLPIWYFSKSGVPPYNNQLRQVRKSLTLLSVTMESDGFYYCYGYNKDTGTWFLSKAELRVFDSTAASHMIISVLEGERTAFGCYANSASWTLEGNPLPSNVRQQEALVTITNAVQSNQGYYECTGINFYYQFFRTRVLVLVYVKEYNKVYPKHQTVRVGDLLHIFCLSKGEVIWRFQSPSSFFQINETLTMNLVIDGKSISQIVIPTVSAYYSGTFICMGMNDHNFFFVESAEVMVLERDNTVSMKVWVSPLHLIRPLHSSVKFMCEVDHDDDYNIEWSFYGQRIPSNSRIMNEMELEIRNINLENSGKYFCLAKSETSWTLQFGYLEVVPYDNQTSGSNRILN